MKKKLILIGFLTLGLSSSFVHADSLSPKKRILVSVGDLKNNDDPLWKKKTCDGIFAIANQVVRDGVDMTCRSFDTDSFIDSGLKNISSKYEYHLRILRTKENTLNGDVTNLRRKNETDFKTIAWKFKDGTETKVTKEMGMAKALGNFFYYVQNETAFKAGLLVNGVDESSEIKYDQKKGVFIDKMTLTPISTEHAYSRFEHESERKRNYLRTGVQIGALLSAGLATYYVNLDSNRNDFDYTLKSGVVEKLKGNAIRFDDNDKFNNYGHEFAGVLYTQAARANGFSSLESFLIGFATSTAWEFIEYHEVLSINDEILTPVGGWVIGEASYQISCALLQKNNVVATTLAYSLNPMLGLNQGIDKLKHNDKYRSQPDCKKTRWSDISVYLGLDVGQKAYDPNDKVNMNFIAGLNATVMNIEKYGEVGSESKVVYDTAMSKALLEMNGNDGALDLKVIAQVVHAAFYQKNISRDEKGELKGYEFALGLGSASTWNDRGTKKKTENEDFYGTVNILGATAHVDMYYKGYNLRLDLGVYGDFTMVKSYSLSKYAEGNATGLEGLDSTIMKRGYYWGAGASTIAAISVQKGNWEFGYNGQFSRTKSIDGFHRLEDQITNHDEFTDTYISNRVYISYGVTKELKLKIAGEINYRAGSIADGYESEGVEKRLMSTVEYRF